MIPCKSVMVRTGKIILTGVLVLFLWMGCEMFSSGAADSDSQDNPGTKGDPGTAGTVLVAFRLSPDLEKTITDRLSESVSFMLTVSSADAKKTAIRRTYTSYDAFQADLIPLLPGRWICGLSVKSDGGEVAKSEITSEISKTETIIVFKYSALGPMTAGFVGGYDCSDKKIGLIWQKLTDSHIQKLHLVWTKVGRVGISKTDLPPTAADWQLDDIPADGAAYYFSLSGIDASGVETFIHTVRISTSSYYIGQVIYVADDGHFSGAASKLPAGVIFETSNTGTDYRMVALQDVVPTKIAWCQSGTCYYGTDNNSLDDGRINTAEAEKYCSKKGIDFTGKKYPAFYYCTYYNAVSGCYEKKVPPTGWYLPSVHELDKIYAQRTAVAAVIGLPLINGTPFKTDDSYWSSSLSCLERWNCKAWTVNFLDGTADDHSGDGVTRLFEQHVRAVCSSDSCTEKKE